MLARAIPVERMEPVTRWIAQVVETVGSFDHLQAGKCSLLNILWQPPATSASPDFLCFGIDEGADHDETFKALSSEGKS